MSDLPRNTEILLPSLPTKTVTFHPTRATIVREIPATIHPGNNTLIIHGLDPKTDFDSIRIEGSGPACVTDFQTEVVRSRLFLGEKDGEDGSCSDDDEEGSSDEEDEEEEPEELRLVRTELGAAKERLALAGVRRDVSGSVIAFLEEQRRGLVVNQSGSGWERQQQQQVEVWKVGEFIDVFNKRGSEEGEKHYRAGVEVEEAEKVVERLTLKAEKVERRVYKEKRKREAAREKERRVREAGKMQRRERKERLEREQKQFRKAVVGEVVVHLEGDASSTVEDGDEDDNHNTTTSKSNVMLRLSYVVAGPTWMPRYDLSINTPASSAKMVYRAEFRNACSETWREARVTLSTSQASFSGLGECIPSLKAWQLTVEADNKNQEQISWEKILRSGPEQPPIVQPLKLFRPQQQQQQQRQQPVTGSSLFGVANVQPNSQQPVQSGGGLFGTAQRPAGTSSLFGPGSSAPPQQAQIAGAPAFGAQSAPPPPVPSAGLFGSAPASSSPHPTSGPLFGGVPGAMSGSPFGGSSRGPMGTVTAAMPTFGFSSRAAAQVSAMPPAPLAAGNPEPSETPDNDVHEAVQQELDVLSPPTPLTADLEHQDSFQQDYGLTTTYDLPGRRTLTPSLVPRRHLLADLDLDSVTLAYMVVPKHRAAAFLRAEIQNSSSVSLLRGKVGITIDGTFLGTADVPSCGPKESFTLPLGVDPLIQVTYGRPTVRRVTGGRGLFFQKEEAAVFRRTCRVRNTRSNAVVVTVVDQVPVSEDEQLRVQILEPNGLVKEGDEVRHVAQVKEGKVRLAKNGEVKWTVKLEPGKDVQLVLEYEARVPVGSEVSEV
ncbi:uncharacterized protein BO97DRAFT_407515 [Aspergillus homomorphus CBS 101889]|uniref:DUF4139 domain-containing protein n=1 Tax=Aspergillus homomorphus (strain CBS 101889) TaxID=1450537 RepID=A0A395HSC3_ASPHC|nr:hypothetical protein BO97DRAFT_407515 [Aspergillus homomorphus CBS 101889]RAL09758.1 hypothetical protein BO97DRAFT_407515 [Aspergillus homomorphus CBS 101889]